MTPETKELLLQLLIVEQRGLRQKVTLTSLGTEEYNRLSDRLKKVAKAIQEINAGTNS